MSKDSNPSSQSTPALQEAAKSDLQKAEDIAYTINHTITCLGLDIFIPVVSAYYTNWRYGSKAQDHGYGVHGHHHDEHFTDHLKEWFTGEIVGDLGAVPVTIAAQRLAPDMMAKINGGMEYALGGMYRWGAERSTANWARQNGVDAGTPEYKEHADRLYHNEVSHLSQAAVWTVSAFGLNVLTQKLIGSSYSTRQIVEGKLMGALLATSTVLGTRAIAPESAEKWDQYTSENVFLPATRVIGSLLGVQKEAVDNMAKKEGILPDTAVKKPREHDGIIEAVAPHKPISS